MSIITALGPKIKATCAVVGTYKSRMADSLDCYAATSTGSFLGVPSLGFGVQGFGPCARHGHGGVQNHTLLGSLIMTSTSELGSKD